MALPQAMSPPPPVRALVGASSAGVAPPLAGPPSELPPEPTTPPEAGVGVGSGAVGSIVKAKLPSAVSPSTAESVRHARDFSAAFTGVLAVYETLSIPDELDRRILHALETAAGDRLDALGYDVETIAYDELAKAESGLTCCSLVFEGDWKPRLVE